VTSRIPALDITHLTKRYRRKTAVDDLSLRVGEGEIFGILGPNGAGKTTTVECAEGLRRPDGGSVLVFGVDPYAERRQARTLVGGQLQESQLPDKLTVAEALELYASFYPARADTEALLARLGLTEKRNTRYRKLSGGQKRSIMTAAALTKPGRTRPRHQRSAFGNLVRTEFLLLVREVVPLRWGAGFPVVLLSIMGLCSHGPDKALAGFCLALLLTAAAMLGLGLLVASMARTGRVAGAAGTMLFLPLMFFAGLWIPQATMPAGLRRVGDGTPLGAAVAALQHSMAGQWPTAASLGVLAAYAVVLGLLAWRFFRWE
jgi:ABC-type thiamine transport system ATPase subunit